MFAGYRDALYDAQLKVYGETVEVKRTIESIPNYFTTRVVFSVDKFKSDCVVNGGRLRRNEVYITFYGFAPEKGDIVEKKDGTRYLVSVYDRDDAVLRLDSDGKVVRTRGVEI